MNMKGTAVHSTGSPEPAAAVSVRGPAAHASFPGAARRHPPPEWPRTGRPAHSARLSSTDASSWNSSSPLMGRRDGVRTRFSALRRPAWRRLIGELDFHDSITRDRRRAACRPARAACGRV